MSDADSAWRPECHSQIFISRLALQSEERHEEKEWEHDAIATKVMMIAGVLQTNGNGNGAYANGAHSNSNGAHAAEQNGHSNGSSSEGQVGIKRLLKLLKVRSLLKRLSRAAMVQKQLLKLCEKMHQASSLIHVSPRQC